jgi:hypothetical protein
MNLSIVPPCWRIIGWSRAKSTSITRFTSSSRSRADIVVEPTTSAKSVVTVRISSAGSAARASSEAPQSAQNRFSSGLSMAHAGQRTVRILVG